MKRRVFHYGKGFGKHTWCGLQIARVGERKGSSPDWGGALTTGITCEDCIVSFICVTAYELDNAAKVLAALRRSKGKSSRR